MFTAGIGRTNRHPQSCVAPRSAEINHNNNCSKTKITTPMHPMRVRLRVTRICSGKRPISIICTRANICAHTHIFRIGLATHVRTHSGALTRTHAQSRSTHTHAVNIPAGWPALVMLHPTIMFTRPKPANRAKQNKRETHTQKPTDEGNNKNNTKKQCTTSHTNRQ